MAHKLSLLLLLVASSLLPKSTPLTCFNFTSFTPNTPGIIYSGDAFASGDNIIQLTRNQLDGSLRQSTGHAVYSTPIQLWDPTTRATADFTTNFAFNIKLLIQNFSGDGFAFFIAPVNYTLPKNSSGEWLGLYNSTTNNSASTQVVAVEFDTFMNAWDPDDNHVGINVNSIVSNATATLISNLKYQDVGSALISFNSTTSNLSVSLAYNATNFRFRNPILTYRLNLSELLPDRVVVGFSAATGHSTELHQILSWQFSSRFDYEYGTITVTRHSKKHVSMALGLVFMFVGVGAAGMGYIFAKRRQTRRRQKAKDPGLDKSIEDKLEKGTGFPRRFTYKELVLATNNFSEDGKLGQGGFGGVYMGVLPDGEKVAVKKIARGSSQGRKEYVSEVTVISRLRHRNLVRLVGWCHEYNEFLLVYEYMPNGSLDYYLSGKRGSLGWGTRYRIVHGLAAGLMYLHEGWEQCVVHRDVKSSNVMLDSGFNARLGDFGLARMVDHELGSQTTVLAGTMGYLAPECVSTGRASKESDVYSFGVVALEVACGRRAVEARKETTEVRLVEWVWGMYGRGQVTEAADQKLGWVFDEVQMERLMIVGLWCSHPDSKSRPSIRQAMNVLALQAPLPSLPKSEPKLVYLPLDISDFSYTPTTTTTTATTTTTSSPTTTATTATTTATSSPTTTTTTATSSGGELGTLVSSGSAPSRK